MRRFKIRARLPGGKPLHTFPEGARAKSGRRHDPMSETAARPSTFALIVRLVIFAILAAAILPFTPQIIAYARHVGFHPHIPALAQVAAIPPQIKLHIVAASAAFLIGLFILLRPKG